MYIPLPVLNFHSFVILTLQSTSVMGINYKSLVISQYVFVEENYTEIFHV